VSTARGEVKDARRCAWRPRYHLIEHVERDELSNVGTGLGLIRAELDPRLKTKVEAHMKLYIFH
jgi:hypothetical protein